MIMITRKNILASSVAVACLMAAAPAFADKVGVTSAVNPNAVGLPPSAQERTLFVGVDMQADERVRTSDKGNVQLLFLDGSALSVGPNSDLVIDKFVYDPQKKVGELGFSAARGVFRLVGGKISKNSEVEFKTPTATIGIRGGIALMQVHADGRLSASFLFGEQMRVTANGTTTTTNRPATIDAPAGGPPSAPRPIAQADLQTALPMLEGTASGSGDSEPTQDQRLADSGYSRTAGDAPTETKAQDNPIQSATETDKPAEIVAKLPPPVLPTASGNMVAQVVLDPFDWEYVDFDPQTHVVSRDPADTQFLSNVVARDGKLEITSPDGKKIALPYRVGEKYWFDQTETNTTEPLDGYAEIYKHSFFYDIMVGGYDYAAASVESVPYEYVWLYGGEQTPAGALPTSGVSAYRAQAYFPAFAPWWFGGEESDETFDNSPLYVRHRANGQPSPHLQATLLILGEGSAQESFMSGEVGLIHHEQGSAAPALGGTTRGSYRWSGSLPFHFSSSLASAQLGNGSAIYGPSGEEMLLVPDVMTYTDSGYVRQPGLGTASYGPDEYYPYPFATTFVRGETPAAVGASLTAATLHGYSGGILDVVSTIVVDGSTDGPSYAYEASQFETANGPNGLVISTDPNTLTVSATAVVRPLDGSISGGTGTIEFGGHGAADAGRSAMIDDNIFAAVDSASRPFTTTDGGGATSSRVFMVTHQAVSNDSWTTTPLCECSYLKWGWWLGTVTDEDGKEVSAHLATWVAGQLPNLVDIPTQGQATYTGHMIGNVQTMGGSYVAAGSFQHTWDFANRNGNLAVTNFDGLNFGGHAASANGRDFAGSISSDTIAGSYNGSFFAGGGSPVAAMAGQFNLQATDGSVYKAAGTFAAQK